MDPAFFVGIYSFLTTYSRKFLNVLPAEDAFF